MPYDFIGNNLKNIPTRPGIPFTATVTGAANGAAASLGIGAPSANIPGGQNMYTYLTDFSVAHAAPVGSLNGTVVITNTVGTGGGATGTLSFPYGGPGAQPMYFNKDFALPLPSGLPGQGLFINAASVASGGAITISAAGFYG